MLKRIASLVVSLLQLTACAAFQTRQDANPAYAQHEYTSPNLDVAWKTDFTDHNARLSGTVTNPRYETIYEYFELTVSLLDANGKTIGQRTFATEPGYFIGGQPMDLEIPVEPNKQVSQLKFFYSYGIGDDRFTGRFKSLP